MGVHLGEDGHCLLGGNYSLVVSEQSRYRHLDTFVVH